MKRRVLAGLLTLIMVLQALAPGAALAKGSKPSNNNLITIGKLTKKDYPQIDKGTALRVAREQKNKRKSFMGTRGATLFSAGSPYINGQQPADPDKPKYWANVQGALTTRGIDGTTFDWDKVLGKGQKVKLLFTQTNGNVMTGVTYSLLVDKEGTYTWQGSDGKPTYLPLYDVDGKPYTYNVQIERNYSKNVQLIVQESNGTPKAKFKQEGDKQVATISFLDIKIQQVASTKFVSEWHTSVAEAERPQIEGYFEADTDVENDFNFPKNDTTRTILRESFVENFEEGDEENGPWAFLASELETTPKTVEVKTDTQGLTFEENNGVKTVKSGDHKYKYDFKYDVINGGKLTMTEVIPVTFDANGGKFASIEEGKDQKIVKEVEYDATLTDKAQDPTKDRETFKGWATAKNGTPLSKEEFEKATKNIKSAKTFYAIWDNNEIKASELTVHESFKNGTKYVNDFIPSLDTLKGKVKIKDGSGKLQKLEDGDTFAIVDGSNEYTADGDGLKNYLYGKLQEKDNPNGEPTRVETVTAKVTHANGSSQTVDISIKVVKNIYEAKTLTEKPYYVPTDYVKVIVDPTTKAKDPQKTYYYVNKDAKVVIPGENPEGTGNYTFVKWTLGEDEYKLKEKPRHQFTEDTTTIEAKYVKNIVPQTGNEKPNVPDNFVLVEFKSGSNGSLDGTTKYWVNPKADKKLSDITHPNIKANDGWKANGWDKGGDTAITGATEVTAQYLEKVLKKEPTENKDKYVKVEFKQGDHGTIANDATTQYWVLKQEEVSLNGPAVTAKTGYAQKTGDGAWSPKIAKYYYEDTEHVAQYDFNGADVIPQKGNDKPDVPDGYILVTFAEGEHGKFAENQTTKYWVNPKKEVTLPAPQIVPNTGYRQQLRLNAWDKYLTATFKPNTTITAQYKELGDILTEEKPGYVKVEFNAGDHGTLDGPQTYWVNPLKNKTLGDITHPKVDPIKGWSHNGWDKPVDTPINAQTASPLVVTAQYLEKVLTETPTANQDKYVTVTFTKGAHGELKAEDTAKYWVLKNADVALTAPGVTPATGYAQKAGDDAWLPKQMTKYSADTEHVAQYFYNGDDVIGPNPDGSKPNTVPNNFVLVEFNQGDHGTIDANQTVKYWVNPNKEVTLTAPSVTANRGYEQKPGFNAWDHYLTATFKEPTTIKAQYNKLGDILTEEKPGYVKVEFKQGEHGTLDGTTIYYVNPDANKKLSDVRHPNVKAEEHWKHVGWDVEESTLINENKDVTAKYLKDVLTTDPQDATNYVKVTFDPGDHGSIAADATKAYWVLKNTEVTFTAPTVTADTAKGYKQKEGKDAWSPEIAKAYSQDTTHVAQYTYGGKDVIPANPDGSKPDNVPNNFVQVTFKPTDKATETGDKIFWVAPNKRVTIDIKKPEGRAVGVGQDNGNTQAFMWNFTKWVSKETKARTWDTNIDTGVTAVFDEATIIEAKYEKIITDQGKVSAEEITVHESYKDGETWVNDFIKTEATKAILEKAVKLTGAGGKLENLPGDATVTLLNDQGQPFADEAALKAALYDKLQEKDDENNPYRVEKLKAKVKFGNGEVQTVDIPMKVIKNIYKADTNGDKPSYVPGEYVKVTLDPTNKATDYQKTYFYVNPNAQVKIPGTDPTGTGDNKFVKWTMKVDSAPANAQGTDYTLKDRHQFAEASTITAQYVSDVIPQEGTTKPDTVPKNYVEVKFVPTDKATDTAEKIYWVNPAKEVTIPVTNPVGKQYFTFKEWKMGADAKGDVYKPTVAQKFAADTTITATYDKAEDIIAYDPKDPKTKPEGYVRVTFAAEEGLTLSNDKAYFVKKDANITLGNPTLVKPTTAAKTGYTFKEWDKKNDFVLGTEDVVVKALANTLPDTKEKKQGEQPPAGYVVVKFVAGENGKLTENNADIAEKVYYVNPNKYVTITPPTPKANMGFAFAAWSKDATIPTVYAEDTTITGSFNGLNDVIPQGKTDGTDKPAGYFTVTFAKGDHGELSGNTVYYVKPKTNVTVPAPTVLPASGYKHQGWDKALTQTFTGDTTITALYEKQKPVDPYPTPQPDPIPQPYPTPQPNFVPYPVPGETKTVYKDRTVLRREVRYMQGFEGKFRPNDGLTRAEAAQILANALKEDGYPFDLRYKLPYKDTTKEMWYNDAVRITTQADVFIGYDDGEFKPQRKITRAEWIATLRRFQYVDKVGGNSLHMRKNHWAIPEVEAAYRSGWLSIYTEKKAPFNYDEPISRKEVAAVSNRAFRRVRDMAYIRRNDKFMTNYTDINRDMWAYDDILCASNTFLHQRQGAYIAYKRGDKAYTIDVKDAIIEQDLFQRIPRHR